MNAIRQFINVEDNSFQVTLPEGFNAKKVEVIIIPSDNDSTVGEDLRNLLEVRLKDYENHPDEMLDFNELLQQLEDEL
ncbi:MAG: hypothetical protein GX159_02265 [Flavobacteriaceae bacterium]|jgi:hypothetical protein|nr:hypothetical protein [Flavobacteriaceae bacterium]